MYCFLLWSWRKHTGKILLSMEYVQVNLFLLKDLSLCLYLDPVLINPRKVIAGIAFWTLQGFSFCLCFFVCFFVSIFLSKSNLDLFIKNLRLSLPAYLCVPKRLRYFTSWAVEWEESRKDHSGSLFLRSILLMSCVSCLWGCDPCCDQCLAAHMRPGWGASFFPLLNEFMVIFLLCGSPHSPWTGTEQSFEITNQHLKDIAQ